MKKILILMILLMNAFILTSCEKEEDPTLDGYYEAEVIYSEWDTTTENVINDCILANGFTRVDPRFNLFRHPPYDSFNRHITTYNWDSTMWVLRNKIEEILIKKYPYDKIDKLIIVKISFNRWTKESSEEECPYKDKFFVARNH